MSSLSLKGLTVSIYSPTKSALPNFSGPILDSKRSSPSLLARQLRLRLVASDDSDVPRNLHNIVVSIHAIATFQALHDYLRPRVAGLMSSGSRLSGMLAALAASGFPGSSSQAAAEAAAQLTKPPPTQPESSAPAATVNRRRSLRLSAKNAGASASAQVEADTATSSAAGSSDVPATDVSSPPESRPPVSAAPTIETALSDTIVDSEMAADFTDDEVDAEVFDDEVDPDNSVADKTVTLSIAEDGSKVEAQTPDGTRVATPSMSARDGPSSSPRNALSTRASYAAALKTKPTDWHLEFSMDEHTLPLDLTIYGAIHQHEMRKKTGALPPSMIWQGVYTIKFKKVAGPLPLPDCKPMHDDIASALLTL